MARYPRIQHHFSNRLANLGNGQPAKLFSLLDHPGRQHPLPLDAAVWYRRGSHAAVWKKRSPKDGIATKVIQTAVQTYGRKFYVMYDISGWTNFQAEIKPDWTNVIVNTLHLTASTAYAKQNGKPVVCVWGAGVSGRPGNVTSWTDVINWFKAQAPLRFTLQAPHATGAHRPPIYRLRGNAADMVSPWSVWTSWRPGGRR